MTVGTVVPSRRGRFVSTVRRLGGDRDLMTWVLVALTALIGSALRVRQLTYSLNEQYGFRQTQTASTVREFAQNGVDLGASPLPVFGPGSSVPMEFPLFQAIASVLVRLGLPDDIASRATSLAFFELGLIPLIILLLRWTNRSVALVAAVLYQFTPFAIEWAAASLIESFAVFLTLWLVVAVDSFVRRPRWWWLAVAVVVSPLAFAVKITTVAPWCLLLLGIAIARVRESGWSSSWRRLLLILGLGPAVGLIAGVAWTKYSDAVKEANPFTSFLTSDALQSWNFGTLQDRLNPALLNMILQRVADTIAGPIALTVVIAIVLVIADARLRHRLQLLSMWGVPFFAVAVFTNLYIQHDYYLAAVFPALVSAVAFTLVVIAQRLTAGRWGARWSVTAVLGVALLFYMWFSPFGQHYASLFLYSRGEPQESVTIRENTRPDDLIIMASCSWDPTILYFAEREGLTLQGDDQPSVPIPADFDLSDYDYVFVCNDSAEVTDFVPEDLDLVEVADDLYKIER